jgi:hypothetical protein
MFARAAESSIKKKSHHAQRSVRLWNRLRGARVLGRIARASVGLLDYTCVMASASGPACRRWWERFTARLVAADHLPVNSVLTASLIRNRRAPFRGRGLALEVLQEARAT